MWVRRPSDFEDSISDSAMLTDRHGRIRPQLVDLTDGTGFADDHFFGVHVVN